jgi:hypothetical protein
METRLGKKFSVFRWKLCWGGRPALIELMRGIFKQWDCMPRSNTPDKGKNKIKLFEQQHVRTVWDEAAEKWWFSVVDIIAVLTDNDHQHASNYWRVLKNRMTAEGNQSVTNCNQLKLAAPDGKKYLTDVADTEQVLRLIQSIPSKKAEPFKMWLAKVGSERIDESIDPELSIDRAIQSYRRLGYSEDWINQRIKTIEVRKALTDEWDKSGVKWEGEYATLTDLMSQTWSGMTTGAYKRHKGLTKENLRDNMTNTELVLNMLAEVAATEISVLEQPQGFKASAKVAVKGAEVAATDISIVQQPVGFQESAKVAVEGAKAAKVAREQIEKSTGKSAISTLNAKTLGQRKQLGLKKSHKD